MKEAGQGDTAKTLMDVLERRCAWCDKVLSPTKPVPQVGAVSHGICLDCTVREFGVSFQRLEGLDRAELDALPYGVIALDFEGTILDCDRTETDDISQSAGESVVGRSFFKEVAPSTAVQQFKGAFEELVLIGNGERSFNFVFGFSGRKVFVKVTLHAVPAKKVVYVLIQKIVDELENPNLG